MDEGTIREMQSLAREVWRREPEYLTGGASVGELAWLWGSGHRSAGDKWRYKLWTSGSRTLAWGWIFPPMSTILSEGEWRAEPASLMWLVIPDRPELLDDLLDWFESEVPDAPRQTVAMRANRDAQSRLERHGYRHDSDAPWGMHNIRDLDEIEEPSLPPGYRCLTMREIADVPRRVEAHRCAWQGSSVTPESYRDVMAAWPYRDDLDFAIEADDGTLAASAIGWYDGEHPVGEFEPVGTHPEYRQHGLGRAILLFGMRRFRDAGAHHAVVGCRGDDHYPAPKRLYRSVGFRELTRELKYVSS